MEKRFHQIYYGPASNVDINGYSKEYNPWFAIIMSLSSVKDGV